jgi:lambda repressor-like predicted transcriptional regulator
MHLENILRKRGISKNQLAMEARISPADFYQAINGKKPFFPAWRQRVSEVLGIPESELFPEYTEKEV